MKGKKGDHPKDRWIGGVPTPCCANNWAVSGGEQSGKVVYG